MGVENPRRSGTRGKKVLVNEEVVIGQKNPQSRMRVVPTHDGRVRELDVFNLVNVLPRFLGESNICTTLSSFFAAMQLHAGNAVCGVPIVPPQISAAIEPRAWRRICRSTAELNWMAGAPCANHGLVRHA